MSRIGWLLIGVISVLFVVLWFFLIFQPTSEDIEDTRAQTEQVLSQAQQERQRAAQLRAVREAAPEAEAALALGRTILPEDPSIPALFRQMQQAADDAGVRLNSISPSAPSNVEVAEGTTLAAVAVTLTVEGSYFQLVDMARRIEDPAITPRALLWRTASLSVGEFPTLNATLSGNVYSRQGVEVTAVDEDEVEDTDETTDETTDGDPDVPEPPPGDDETEVE